MTATPDSMNVIDSTSMLETEDGGDEFACDDQLSNHSQYTTVEDLHPPQSSSEAHRDQLLRILDRPVFQTVGLVVILLIVADGAFFFFLLVGWQAMCRPRTDCDPRNWWYNWSIQILNILFTYQALITMPWRSTNFLHLAGWSCPHRNNHPGLNLYGVSDSNLWFHIPVRRRLSISTLLLGNCIFQFFNQGTRFYFYNHERQGSFPGNIWTNVFFAASFACAGAAGLWQAHEAARLRAKHPRGTFGPGPLEILRNLWDRHGLRNRKKKRPETSDFDVSERSAELVASTCAPETEDVGDATVEQPNDHPSLPQLQRQQQLQQQLQQHHRRHSGDVRSTTVSTSTAFFRHHRRNNSDELPRSSSILDDNHHHHHHRHGHVHFVDPTRDPQMRHILPEDDRAGLRLWGL